MKEEKGKLFKFILDFIDYSYDLYYFVVVYFIVVDFCYYRS